MCIYSSFVLTIVFRLYCSGPSSFCGRCLLGLEPLPRHGRHVPVEYQLFGHVHGRGEGDVWKVSGEAAGVDAEHGPRREVNRRADEHVLQVDDGARGNEAVQEWHEPLVELARGVRGKGGTEPRV